MTHLARVEADSEFSQYSSAVEQATLAVLSAEIKELLSKLAGKYTVALVSGRPREDMEKLVGQLSMLRIKEMEIISILYP